MLYLHISLLNLGVLQLKHNMQMKKEKKIEIFHTQDFLIVYLNCKPDQRIGPCELVHNSNNTTLFKCYCTQLGMIPTL